MFNILLTNPIWAQEIPSLAKLPTLENTALVNYPENALQEGRGGEVLLELLVSENGEVLNAIVVEGLDVYFDRAALNAVTQYTFSPALDENGQATAAQIQFRFKFDPKLAPPLVLKGIVVEGGIRKPINLLEIRLTNETGEVFSSTTDEDGTFFFRGVPAGTWLVGANSPQFKSKTETIEIVEGQITEISFFLVRDQARSNISSNAEIVVEDRRSTSDITQRNLSASEIQYLPGSGGDVVKAVQNLPGIARAPLGIGQLIIRGTAPEDSTYYIDGGNIPEVFHFGGLTTVLNADVIEEVSFLPGNYSVRYGRQLGGVVDIKTSTKFPERNRGYTAVDLYQSTAFTEAKINDKLALSLSGRRSYADVFLSPLLSGSDLSVRAPRYYDFQSRLLYKPAEDNLLDILFFLSDDQFRFLGKDAEGNETTVSSFGTRFKKVRVKWKRSLSSRWLAETVLVSGPATQDFIFNGSSNSYDTTLELNLREERTRPITPESMFGWKYGIDVYSGQFRFDYNIPSFPGDPEIGEYLFLSPALYFENTARLRKLELISGIRAEGYTLEGGICVPAYDPRLSWRYSIGDFGFFKGGIGRFSQFPTPRQLSPDADGNPKLKAQQSTQLSLGYEQAVFSSVRLELTGYYNQLNDLVVGREDRFRFFTGPPPIGPFDTEPYANASTGRIYGLETQIRYNGPNTIALIAATFSRSERINRAGELRLFTYDQPFVINALLSQQLPKNWRLGSRLRYSAGNPYTPVVNRIYNLNERSFQPVYGPRDSVRIDPFFAIDVRIDRKYVFRTWSFTAYLDIQNVTYAKNVELMSWSYDYSQEEPIEGQPPLPAFGFRGEW